MLAHLCNSFWRNASNDCSKHGGGALQVEGPGVGQAIRKQVYPGLSGQGLLLLLRGLSAQEQLRGIIQWREGNKKEEERRRREWML